MRGGILGSALAVGSALALGLVLVGTQAAPASAGRSGRPENWRTEMLLFLLSRRLSPRTATVVGAVLGGSSARARSASTRPRSSPTSARPPTTTPTGASGRSRLSQRRRPA